MSDQLTTHLAARIEKLTRKNEALTEVVRSLFDGHKEIISMAGNETSRALLKNMEKKIEEIIAYETN